MPCLADGSSMIFDNCLSKSGSERPLESRENDFSRRAVLGFTICFFFLSITLISFTGLLFLAILIILVCPYYTKKTIFESKISLIEFVSVSSPKETGILSVIMQFSLLLWSSERYLASSSLPTWSINSASFILKKEDV